MSGFQFSVRVAGASPPPPSLSFTSSSVIVDATVITSNPCVDAAARVARAGSALTLTVTVGSNGAEVCVAAIGALTYRAEVAPLAAGRYALVVRHAFTGVAAMDTVVRQSIIVP